MKNSRKTQEKQKEILKKALVLRETEGWAWQDIAVELGVHKDTIKNYRDKYGENLNDLYFGKILPEKNDKNIKNLLVIGDLHEPFCLDDYLDFCLAQYKKYKCNHVIFIGDIIDNHYSSYHEPDPDGMGAGHELALTKKRIQRWYQAFPLADVVIGNHDRMVMRKAKTAGVSSQWIKSYSEVLDTPGWTFGTRFEYNGVQYIHGEGGTARSRCKKDLISTVQGHLHPQAYCEHTVGANFHIFGMQVGCGIDHKSYAMDYAKDHPKPAIGCSVVLNDGQLPINILANLKEGSITI